MGGGPKTMTPFLTLAAPAEAETRVRGSRFLALAAPVEHDAEARELLHARSRAYFDATHHCAAWRLRDRTSRTVDAGEPSGSAGAPILTAIDGRELVDTLVVVTRYFGGTKLGVGGLARAYAAAAAAALDRAPKRRGLPGMRVRIRYDYPHTSAVMHSLDRVTVEQLEHGFADDLPSVSFALPATDLARLSDLLQRQTAGTVGIETLGEMVFYQPDHG
jgi:uncharacterized YigZ family protein